MSRLPKQIAMRPSDAHVSAMNKVIEIYGVAEPLRRRLEARAASTGMSLSDFLLEEIGRIAEQPTLDELRARLATRSAAAPSETPECAIRAERNRR